MESRSSSNSASVTAIAQLHSLGLEGVLEFPGLVVVSGTQLGSKYPIQIADQPGSLILPSIPPGWTASQSIPDLMPPAGLSISLTQRDWGSVYSMPDGVAGLTAAAVQFPVPVTSDDRASAALRAAESLRDNASAWLDRLASWLAGLTRDAIFVDFRAQPRQFHSGNPMLFAVTGDGPAKRVPGRVDINVNLRTVTPASHGHWETALKRASAGVELPLEHALMNSARLAIAHADYRRAVLDSATAAELSLSSEIKRALDRISQFPALSKFLQGKHNTLELLRQLAPSIGVSLPNNLQVVIGHPRKFAMHHGTLPTKADTEAAVRMAEELVERASPIA